MALPAWPVYGAGALVVLSGFALLHRWLQGLTGRRDHPSGSVLAASFVAFLVGAGTLVAAVGLDNEVVRNTRTFAYHVSIDATGAGPFLLVLPAPEDERLRDAFNQTKGPSTMRYVRAGPEPSVDVVTNGRVNFSVSVTIVGPPFNTNMTRLDRPQPIATNMTIYLADEGSVTSSAAVRIEVRFEQFCGVRQLSFNATVVEGLAEYPFEDTVEAC